MLGITKRNAKTVIVILGFASTVIGAMWSFLVADRLSKEMRDLTEKKVPIGMNSRISFAGTRYLATYLPPTLNFRLMIPSKHFPFWVEYARPGITRAINISNQGPKFASKLKWQNLRRDDVSSGRACLIHNDDRISRPGRCLT